MNSTCSTHAKTAASSQVILWAILIGTFIGTLGNSIANITVPYIMDEFSTPLSSAIWVVTINTLLFAVLMPVSGYLGDMYGQKKMYLIGITLVAISSLGSGLAKSFPILIIFRAINGIGVAPTLPAVMAIITRCFEPEQRGQALGVWALVNGAGHAVGPPLSGFLTFQLGWRYAYLVNLPLSLLCIYLVWRLAPADLEKERTPLDFKGALTLTTAALGIMLALTFSAQKGWLSAGGLALWGLVVVSVIGFIFFEKRSDHPFVKLDLFADRQYRAATIMIAAQFFCLFGMLLALPVYLIEVLGMDSQTSGLVVLPLTLAMALIGPPAGHLADRYGSRIICTVGMSMVVLGGIILLLVRAAPLEGISWVILIASLIVIGSGMGLTQSPSAAVVIQVVEEKEVGVASGISHMIRFASGSLGSIIFGLLLGSNVNAMAAGFRSDLVALVVAAGISLFFATQLPGSVQQKNLWSGK
jgi:EmrB/QacA subfamily drug resistance transporter